MPPPRLPHSTRHLLTGLHPEGVKKGRVEVDLIVPLVGFSDESMNVSLLDAEFAEVGSLSGPEWQPWDGLIPAERGGGAVL